MRDFLVNRGDIVAAAAIVKLCYHSGVGTADQPQNTAFSAAVGANIADFRQYPVTMHRRTDGRGRNENISSQACLQALVERTGLRDDEAEAVAVHAQAPDCQIFSRCGLRNGIAVGIDLHQLPLGDELLEPLRERAASISPDA